jgi:hypothetical protein
MDKIRFLFFCLFLVFTPLTAQNQPTEAELLWNGDFETNLDGWTVTNKSKDRLKCNTETRQFARTGNCAYRFQGGDREKAKLTQKPNIAGMIIVGNDTVTLRTYYKTNAVAPRLRVKLRVFYTDDILPDGKRNGIINTVSADDYTLFALETYTLEHGSVGRIKVQFHNRATRGKIYLDDASLTLVQQALR